MPQSPELNFKPITDILRWVDVGLRATLTLGWTTWAVTLLFSVSMRSHLASETLWPPPQLGVPLSVIKLAAGLGCLLRKPKLAVSAAMLVVPLHFYLEKLSLDWGWKREDWPSAWSFFFPLVPATIILGLIWLGSKPSRR